MNQALIIDCVITQLKINEPLLLVIDFSSILNDTISFRKCFHLVFINCVGVP